MTVGDGRQPLGRISAASMDWLLSIGVMPQTVQLLACVGLVPY
jgi:hypothetical protein